MCSGTAGVVCGCVHKKDVEAETRLAEKKRTCVSKKEISECLGG